MTMVAESIRVAVLLALLTDPSSTIGEQIPKSVIDLAHKRGLIGVAADGLYLTDAGRDRMVSIMEAIA
jgi:hypothetical protein